MKKQTGMVQHVNLVSGWENPKQHEIFCKKAHRVLSVDPKNCEKCPYFVGNGQSDSIICRWEDTLTNGNYNTKVIMRSEAQDELLRVSSLIDQGVIKKG